MSADASPLPFVSVVMPIRDESAHVGRCLAAVLGQTYPSDRVEVLVVDGMSTDGTREIVLEHAARNPNVTLLDNPGRIVSKGLNSALERARGDVVVRVDGHCEIGPDYLERSVSHLRAGLADCVGGPLETTGETARAKAIAAAMSSRFGVGGAPFRTGTDVPRLVDTVAFPAFTRGILDRAGRFDEELVRDQDDEYSYRIRELGGRILLAPDVRSRYFSRTSFRALFRQYLQYGYWKVRVLQRHPLQMRPRQFAPPLLVLALLATGLAAPFFPPAALALSAIAGAWAAASLVAAVLVARRNGWSMLPLLPAVFAILHLSYGAGFLAGLVRFAGRWREAEPAIGGGEATAG